MIWHKEIGAFDGCGCPFIKDQGYYPEFDLLQWLFDTTRSFPLIINAFLEWSANNYNFDNFAENKIPSNDSWKKIISLVLIYC